MRPIGAADIDGSHELGDDAEAKREKVLAELVLPEMLASCMTSPYQVAQPLSVLVSESSSGDLAALSATSLAGVAETWRPRGGGLTTSAEAVGASSGDQAVEGKLVTHIDAGDLGKICLVVERTSDGMKISLGVDNPLTAASATMQRSALEQSLRASGLGVVKVTIARSDEDGTELAQSPYAPQTERWRKRLNLTG